jgi:hypothetical protein
MPEGYRFPVENPPLLVDEGGRVVLAPQVQAQLDRIEAMLKQLLERK